MSETAGKRPQYSSNDIIIENDEEKKRPDVLLLFQEEDGAYGGTHGESNIIHSGFGAVQKDDLQNKMDDGIISDLAPSERTNLRPKIMSSSAREDEDEDRYGGIKTAPLMDTMNGPGGGEFDEEEEEDSSSDDGNEEAVMQPLLMRSISMAASSRSKKTRLQDPPSLTPAIQRQLTHCRTSTMFRKTASSKVVSSGEQMKNRQAEQQEEEESMNHPNYSTMSQQQQQQQQQQQEVNNIHHHPAATMPPININAEDGGGDNLLDDDDIIPAKKKKKLHENNNCFAYLQIFILILLVVFLVCSYKLQILSEQMFLGFHLWRWIALALVVFCGHLLSGWAVTLIAMLIERHYVLKKRVLYFVYGLRGSVRNCVWLALVLGVWESIHEGHENIPLVQIVTKILWCLFTATVSWMFKVLAVKVAANSFHRKAYFERIQESVFNQHLLEILSAPPRMMMAEEEEDPEEEDPAVGRQSKKQSKKKSKSKSKSKSKKKKKIQFADVEEEQVDGGGQSSSPPTMHPTTTYEAPTANVDESPPAFTTVEVGELPVPTSSSSADSAAAGHGSSSNNNNRRAPLIARSPLPIAQNKLQELTADTVSVWTLKSLMKVVRKTNISTYSSMLSHHEAAKDGEINSESQAKSAAKQIFYNMARPGQKTLTIKDFLRFLPEDQAMRAISLFEVTESGEVTKQSLANWVIAVFKERRALALTLNDSRTVVAKLHRVLDVVLMLALIIVFLLIFGIETSKLLVFFTSVFIPSVFVFGNSARNTFEALIFLFIIHPFDVGDRVVVDGQGMLVEEMNVLNTVFLGPTSEKIYYPNSILTQKSITNYYRSPDQGDAIDFQVHMKTPVEKLGMLKERIQRYIEAFPQCWYPEFRIICDKIHDCNKVNLMIWIRHRINYQDIGERFQRRSNLLLYLKQQLEDLNIGYQLPNQEIMVTGIPLLKMP